MPHFARPAAGEYAPAFQRYVDLVSDGDVPALLETQGRDMAALLQGVSEAQARYRYAPGKWSVKEVVGHVADTERVMAYRALRIARGDATPLAGFDENAYVAQAGFDERPLEDLTGELQAVRRATLVLLRSLPPDALARTGTANGAAVSVRALAYIIAGHALHHERLLHERYGIGAR